MVRQLEEQGGVARFRPLRPSLESTIRRWDLKKCCLTFAAFVVFGLPGSAGATALYDNLAFPNSSSFLPVGATTWAANGFSTDNNTYQLSDVVLALEGVATTGTLTVSLYGNSAGVPNTDLATLGTISDNLLSTSSFTQQTVAGGNFTLLPNTSYFILLSGSTVGGADADWERENGAGGTGVAGQVWGASGNSGSTWIMHGVSTDFQPLLMRVDVSSPEPGTITGALGGLVFMLLVRRRRA